MSFDRTQHTIWVEKYRPDTLSGYIGNEALKAKIVTYIDTSDIPHLLFVGPPGTGKTTISKILVNNIESDSLILNASDDNNIETVRGKIRGFASTLGFNALKILVLDEFDGFTRQGQEALRNLMEQFSMTTRFILTANYIERVIPPIVSRTQTFHVVPPSRRDVAIHVANILRSESVTFKATDLKLIIDAHFPDIRKIIGEMQLATRDGVLQLDQQHLIESDYKLKLLAILRSSGDINSRLIDIRQLIADAAVRDFSDVYRLLFDRVHEFAPKHIPEAILAIDEGLYKDALVVDKEIAFAATIVNLLQVTK